MPNVARQILKYRVDFFMTFSKRGKEQAMILEYDGVEYHTKNQRTYNKKDEIPFQVIKLGPSLS